MDAENAKEIVYDLDPDQLTLDMIGMELKANILSYERVEDVLYVNVQMHRPFLNTMCFAKWIWNGKFQVGASDGSSVRVIKYPGLKAVYTFNVVAGMPARGAALLGTVLNAYGRVN